MTRLRDAWPGTGPVGSKARGTRSEARPDTAFALFVGLLMAQAEADDLAYASPLPPARVLGAYEEVAPGSADRIIRVFEQQAIHRMAIERIRVERDARRADRGLIAGTVVALAVLMAAVFCAWINQPWLAGILGGLDIVTLAGIFIYGTERRRSERLETVRMLRGAGLPTATTED